MQGNPAVFHSRIERGFLSSPLHPTSSTKNLCFLPSSHPLPFFLYSTVGIAVYIKCFASYFLIRANVKYCLQVSTHSTFYDDIASVYSCCVQTLKSVSAIFYSCFISIQRTEPSPPNQKEKEREKSKKHPGSSFPSWAVGAAAADIMK